jgi:hypothetical protein
MRFIAPLKFLGTSPWPDYAVRPSVNRWKGWGCLTPCFFSAECKRRSTNGGDTEAQLAMNSNPILTIFAIMYLDIRTDVNEGMPPWMWVYALIYTEDGFDVYAHSLSTGVHPKLIDANSEGSSRPDAKGPSNDAPESEKTQFVFKSTHLLDRYSLVFRQDADHDHRMRALTALYMIRSHTLFVIEQVESWVEKIGQNGGSIMNKLIARAQYELGNIKWLQEEIKRVNALQEENADEGS